MKGMTTYDTQTGHYRLNSKYAKYTMLVAWHKFDKYERVVLATLMETDINKLPFMQVEPVWKALVKQANLFKYAVKNQGNHFIPLKNYRDRIERAVLKEYRKTHRVRLRLSPEAVQRIKRREYALRRRSQHGIAQ